MTLPIHKIRQCPTVMMIVSSLAGQKTKTDDADVMRDKPEIFHHVSRVQTNIFNLRSPELIDLVARWD